MQIRHMLATGSPTVSFEFFPPKQDQGFASLFQTIDALRSLRPSYVSVTYGAGGSTRQRTVELVKRIKRDTGIEAMAHITCVGATREQISGVLDSLQAARIENVLPLRGDLPQGADRFEHVAGGFRYANELVGFIRRRYRFCLGAACYPETHPEAASPEDDLANLKRKVDAGADFLITQLFFDNDDFLRFRDRAAGAGISVPMLAGIMPVRSLAQTQRFAKMCGARIPAALLARLEAVRDSPAQVRAVGIDHATSQCKQLLAEGVAGLHFYTLNHSTATQSIYRRIQSRLGH
ncbi:MAG: methylenetetrahydrofolate reductase [NAD(P)H] [Bryobacterales bacterium]|nr:methylenetetrahydrofolate reductase [NAD(P)H] [Bryobacterales bacterium]